MKISRIETIVIRIPYDSGGPSEAEVWGGQAWETADALLVKVTTDEGITGWGEAFGYNVIAATKSAIDQVIAPLFLGKDPRAIEDLMREAQQKLHIFGRAGPVIYGLSGLDIALWDIAGKACGQPVHRLLGGTARTTLDCYASLIRYGTDSLVSRNVHRALDLGFRHIKLHEIELSAVAAARATAGEAIALMNDVNCPWSLQQAICMAEQLRPFNLFWLEEPIWPPEDHAALAQVRARVPTPIAAGENAATLHQFQHLFQAAAVDIAQPSPAKMGGLSELRKVYALASAYNVRVIPHTFYDGPAFLAGLHASAALSSDPLVEWRFFDLHARLYGDNAVPVNGKVDVPGGAGLGFDPDPDVIARYST
jgi:L-alanine-DL-glutamate epimerase-like enolase superfamily enzyme